MPRPKKSFQDDSRTDIFDHFVPSDTPQEDWGDDDEEWPVDAVVEEDIDVFGRKQ